jgi:hypothetical protein
MIQAKWNFIPMFGEQYRFSQNIWFFEEFRRAVIIMIINATFSLNSASDVIGTLYSRF